VRFLADRSCLARGFGLGLVIALAAGGGCAGRRLGQEPGAPPLAPPIHPGRPLAVAILAGVPRLDVTCAEPLTVVAGRVPVAYFRSLGIESTGGSMKVVPKREAARSFADTLQLNPPPGLMFEINGKSYRGALELINGSDGLTVINRVDLEDYLLGVVPLEIGSPPAQSYAAVAAQSIAARTYAISHLDRWRVLGFDLYGDERDQVYGGAAAETPLASRGVRETQGIVATYGGELIGAYYSAACGGTSAAVQETWAFPPAPYLAPHPDRDRGPDYCRQSRHYRWQEHWTAEELAGIIRRNLGSEVSGAQPVGDLEDLTIVGRNSSGRVRELVIRMGGQDYHVLGDRIRWVLRRPEGRILRSTSFDLTLERAGGRLTGIQADGRGNGHGVGMCQAGALEMAAEGHDYAGILGHYYRGCQLERLRDARLSAAHP